MLLRTPAYWGPPVMPALYNNVLETIGNTPIVRISKPAPPGVDLFVKLEAFPATDAARDFVAQTIGDTNQPVVMFALEWCEFCWSVRKLFTKCGIDYRSVDIDSAALKQDDWGGQIRSALIEHNDFKTLAGSIIRSWREQQPEIQ